MADPVVAAAAHVYEFLEQLTAEQQRRALLGAAGMLGVSLSEGEVGPPVQPGGKPTAAEPVIELSPVFGRWLRQHQLVATQLEGVFLIAGSNAEIILETLPAESKKEQTAQCYLLVGLRGVIQGQHRFSEAEALKECRRLGCHDRSNHATHRRAMGHCLSGTKQQGFALTPTGMAAAADLIRHLDASGGQRPRWR